MQDYEAGAWATMYRIPAWTPLDTSSQVLGKLEPHFACRMVVLNERELLIKLPRCQLLHYQINRQLLRDVVVKCDKEGEDRVGDLDITLHSLQESIIPFPFFSMQEEDALLFDARRR